VTERAAVQMVSEAVRDAVAEQLDDDERQLGLFSAPVTEAGQALFRDRAKRGRGRPQGSRNKRDEMTVGHLMQRYRDPRAVALERIQMHPADLAAQLGCSLAEADDKQRLWAATVLPFIAARITPEVPVTFKGFFLTVQDGGAAVANDAGGAAPVVLDRVEYVEIEPAADQPSAATSSDLPD